MLSKETGWGKCPSKREQNALISPRKGDDVTHQINKDNDNHDIGDITNPDQFICHDIDDDITNQISDHIMIYPRSMWSSI